ncbi:hypothetical protein TRFO_40620 [Tritrichomonas foetus]|uniref:Beige/BEACH domain containing protein n=1 Tax=Tritrichomonas foetus TaxID=1144522 RepID=A0A1J4J2X2_9EUKA|nr:hypothetical protein TRFO_40620 [Tritrichomonas foetus]|eukprot:OHS93089.1 hypothetical protein TRFO_40620 [Tritrichomonas foetus]
MIEILSPSELSLQIMNIKLHDSSQFSCLDRITRSLNPNGSFPTFSYLELRSFGKQIKEGIDFVIFLKKKNFSFRFDPESLNSMMSNPDILNNAPDYAVVIGLYSYISWYLRFVESRNVSDIELILDFLLFIMKVNNTKVPKAHCLTTSAFMHIYSDVVETTYIEDVSILFTPLVQYLTMNDDLPQCSFDLLLKTATRVIDPTSTHFTKETTQFSNFMVMIMRTCGQRYPQPITTAIVFLMRNSLLGLDDEALQFFGRSLLTLGIDEAVDIVTDFPEALVNKIKESKPVFPLDVLNLENSISLPPLPIKNEKQVIENSTLILNQNLNNLLEIPKLPQTLPLATLLPPSFETTLDYVSRIACMDSKLVDLIVLKIYECIIYLKINEYYYDIITTFFYLLDKISKTASIKSFAEEILVSPVFSDSFNLFKPNEKYDKINTIRTLIFSIIMLQPESIFENCFEKLRIFPGSFSEFVVRFLPGEIDCEFLQQNLLLISREFIKTFLFYQQFSDLAQNILETINHSRLMILTWLDCVLKNPIFADILFDSDDFDYNFSYLILEVPVCDFALSHITKYIIQNNNPSPSLIKRLFETFCVVFKSQYKNECILIAQQILNFLNEVIEKSPNIGKGLEPIIPIVCKWAAGMPKNEQTLQLLASIMELFSSFLMVHTISQSELSAIEKVTRSFYDNEPTEQFFRQLLSLVAGHKITDSTPCFVIRQPKAVKLIVNLYEFSSAFPDKLKFITELCQFSSTNCEQLQKGEFDSYIVSKINSWRDDKNVSEIAFDESLKILSLISSKVSNLTLVQQFISLFCPINGSYLCRFQENLIKSLQNILNMSSNVPIIPMKLTAENFITIDGMKTNDIVKEYTISCWLCLSSLEKQATVFTISNRSNFLLTMLLGKNLEFTLSRNMNIHNCDLTNINAPLNKWFLLIVNFSQKGGNTYIYPYINFKPIFNKDYILPALDLFADEDLVVTVGGVPASDNMLFGSFSMYNNLFDIQKDLSILSPRYILGNQDSLIFNVDAKIKKNNIIVNLTTNNLNLQASLVSYAIKNFFSSFGDILAERCGVVFIIPLLAQVQLKYQNDEPMKNQVETFFDVLCSGLLLSDTSQNQFSSDNGFLIISHLLMQSSNELINYELYLQLYNIFIILHDKGCRYQLLFGILIRIDLWLKANASDNLKILEHWADVLFPNYFDEINERINFFQVIASCRIFYWYNTEEIKLIKCLNRCHSEVLDVKECRRNLFKIAYLYTENGLIHDYFRFVISQILTVSDSKQIIDLLKLAKFLIKKHPDNIAIFQPLVYLFFLYSPNEEITETIFDLLIDAHINHLFGEITLSQHISLIMHQLPKNYSSNTFLTHLVKVCQETTPDIFPLLMMIVFSLGQDSINYVIENLEPKKEICANNQFWTLWAVVILYNSSLSDNLFDFMIKIDCKEWKNIYNMIDALGCIFQLDSSQMKKFFLSKLSTFVNESNAKYYFELVPNFLFVRPKNQFNKMLIQSLAFNKSGPLAAAPRRVSIIRKTAVLHQNRTPSMKLISRPLKEIEKREKRTSQTRFSGIESLPISINELTEKIKLYTSSPANTQRFFGLRINHLGKWEDDEIVKTALDLFIQYPVEESQNDILFIAAYQLRFNKEQAFEAVDLMNNPESCPAASVYNYHLHRFGLTDHLMNLKQDFYIPKNFEYLKKFEETNCNMHFMDDLTKYLSENSKYATGLYNSMKKDYWETSSEYLADFKNSHSISTTKCSKLWNHFWRSMTVDRAPWNLSLKEMARTPHFKRDYTGCTNFCQVKLRQNFSFDDHIKASLARDMGSISNANQIVKMKNNERHTDQTFFDIIEDSSSEEKNDSITTPGSPLRSNIILETNCEIITISHTSEATFILQPTSIILKKGDCISKIINIKDINSIFLRTNLHRHTAIEIFEENGASTFVNFTMVKAQAVLKKIKMATKNKIPLIQTQSFKTFPNVIHCTEQWVNRTISNFEYLMYLNIFSGRSFNNASQYPIMPWILKNYVSESIDLNDNSNYRDLSRPIGSFNEIRMDILTEQYQTYKSDPSMGIEPYLYSSAPISPISLYLYLLRMEPFTTLHIDIQSGMFDVPDRLFQSIPSTFESVTSNVNDYRELIPEFFFQPEFLQNLNHFDLGKVDGKPINDVTLPPWASSPIEFVYLNRKALESEYVSSHLNEWIDLIFGDKQNSMAVKNVYQREMYSDIWETPKGKDEINLGEIESILSYVGQIPQPLFDKPHPSRISNTAFPPTLARNDSSELNSFPSDNVTDNMGPVTIKTPEKIQVCQITKIDSKTISLLSIDDYGDVSDITLNIVTKEIKVKSSKINKFDKVHTPGTPLKCTFSKNHFAFIVGNIPNEIYMIDLNKGHIKTILRKRSEIVSIDSNDFWFASADLDAIVTLHKIDDLKEMFNIHSFRDSIKCCAINQNFHLFVCGTRDCSLMFCSLTSKSIVRVQDLGSSRPSSLLITPSWGFVIVCLKEVLEGRLKFYVGVLTVNGTMIVKNRLKNKVLMWVSWKDNKGFDYVLMADVENKVYMFEAFYAKIEKPIFESDEKIVKLEFLEHEKTAVIVTESGKVTLLPCVIE